MCHPDSPDAAPPAAEHREVTIELGDGATMDAFLATPVDRDPRGSVLVIGDIFGARSSFYEHLAGLLAELGFAALVPEYFHRVGELPAPTYEDALSRKGRLDENRALADLEEAIEWQLARVAGRRIGVVGFCLGGTFALDLSAARDDLATVCYYGFPAGSPGPPSDLTAPAPLDRVEEISGPLVGFWGSRDERVGIPNVERFVAALTERGVDLDATILPGLDHGFLQAAFDQDADGHDLASRSWKRTIAFLAEAVAPE